MATALCKRNLECEKAWLKNSEMQEVLHSVQHDCFRWTSGSNEATKSLEEKGEIMLISLWDRPVVNNGIFQGNETHEIRKKIEEKLGKSWCVWKCLEKRVPESFSLL